MLSAFFTRRKRVAHPDAPDLVRYQSGAYPHPSFAQTAVFEPMQTLPVFLVRGSGQFPRQSLAATEGNQAYITPAVPEVSIGGLQAGGIELQPLIDPYKQGA